MAWLAYTSGSSTTWECWNSTTNGSSTTNTWSSWTSGADTTTGNVVWNTWVDTGTSANVSTWTVWVAGDQTHTVQQPTEEQRAEWRRQDQERQEQWAREAEERRKAQEKADQKADQLLHELLTQEQADDLLKTGGFIVVSEKGNLYRIKRGRSMNVYELDRAGKEVARLCAHPRENVPNGDTMAAQLLMLQLEEDRFLELANRSRIH